MDSNGCEELMQAWFPVTTTTERKPLTETDIRDIAQVLLRASDLSWSRIPRIYSVLRIIGQLQAIDSFLAEGITDVWFPFSQRSLPASFRTQSARLDFLDAQQLVFNTKGLNLEREHTRHGHFPDATEIPLKKIGELGKGGYGFVDRVVSTISHREYARKLIPRGRTFKKDKQVLRAFERELSNLKSLSRQHSHIIELVGSYTDPKYVGIIMLPVADCNLHEFLTRPLGDGEKSLLRTFFGCLTSALCFLHDNRIRHKDIKPQNVLVKNGHVFFTDFGISLDWTELCHSTTTGPTWSTPRYGAPEVAEHSARNSSADIWSLGCVFLEIWTVLKQKTTQALNDHMESTGTLSSCYCSNITSVGSWIETIKELPGPPIDNVPSVWILQMLQRDRDARWTAHILAEHIHEHSSDPSASFAFAGLCCLDDDNTSESVHSSIDEDDELTLHPTISSISKSHASETDLLSRQASDANNANASFSHIPLPRTLLVATEDYRKNTIDSPGQSHLVTHLQDQPRQKYPPQPYAEDEEISIAREVQSTVAKPIKTPVPSSNKLPTYDSDSSSVWGWVLEDDLNWESKLRRARALSIDSTTNRQASLSQDQINKVEHKETRNRVSKRKEVPTRLYGEYSYSEFSSDDSMMSNFDQKPYRESAANSSHRGIHDPDRHRSRSPPPLRYSPTAFHKGIPRPKRDSYEDDLPANKTPRVECLICLNDDLPANKTAKLGCGHRMCHPCLKRQFTLSVNDPEHMPPTCCTADHIPLKYVDRLFDDTFKRLWNRKYQEYITANQLYCPKKECGSWIKPSRIRIDLVTGRKYARCGRCSTKVCILCKGNFHTRRECPRDKETNRPAQTAKDKDWQRCYNCKAIVESKEGCNHITCRCTAQFCIVCAAPWKTCNCPWFNYTELDDSDRLGEIRVPYDPHNDVVEVIEVSEPLPPLTRRANTRVRHRTDRELERADRALAAHLQAQLRLEPTPTASEVHHRDPNAQVHGSITTNSANESDPNGVGSSTESEADEWGRERTKATRYTMRNAQNIRPDVVRRSSRRPTEKVKPSATSYRPQPISNAQDIRPEVVRRSSHRPTETARHSTYAF